MSLSASECLYPVWRLKAEVIWPGKSASKVSAILTGLIAQANAQTVIDEVVAGSVDLAAKWYTAYLAWGGRLEELSGLAASIDVRDEGSRTYLASQMDRVQQFRDDALAEYLAVVAAGQTVPEAVSPPIRQSQRIRQTFEW